jgi:hypothetical protein
LKAGAKLVSPISEDLWIFANEEEEWDSEGELGPDQGEVCERIRLRREDEVIKKIRDPKLPSDRDVEDHYLSGHLPYRDWCHICVGCKGKNQGHERDKGGERDLPEYAWDFCFPGDSLGYKWTVLVGKERQSKSRMAVAIPTKGGMGMFSVDKCLEFVEENGDRRRGIIAKTDQENSAKFLIKEIFDKREEGKTLVEESKKGSSGSNGIVEREVQEIEGAIRSLFMSLQERICAC